MPLTHSDAVFGRESRDRLADANDPGTAGAYAALESFYHAFNTADLGLIRDVWLDDPLVQLNNPVGGILRGRDGISAVYGRIFGGPVRPWIEFGDIVEMSAGPTAIVFAGREHGALGDIELAIRTTRCFAYSKPAGGWRQVHHHGSIDDPEQLRRYQEAVSAA